MVGGKQGRTPGALAESLSIPPATLSFHLKELVGSGLITQERSSRNLIYRATYERVNDLLEYLTDNCCEGQECVELTARACDC